jgi:antibiotic biosynthesis monooxygenase (ABM) superfamily enzyme
MDPAPERITVVVHRRIRPGKEIEFEHAMRGFIKFALSFPGHLAIHVLRPPDGMREFTVIDEFAGDHARREFRASDAYREWMGILGDLTEGDPHVEELTGLETWFTASHEAALARPPAWKMALTTYPGVVVLTLTLRATLGNWTRSWPTLPANLLFNAFVVAGLTWLVMPFLTRLLRRWLFPPRD